MDRSCAGAETNFLPHNFARSNFDKRLPSSPPEKEERAPSSPVARLAHAHNLHKRKIYTVERCNALLFDISKRLVRCW